MKCIYCGKEYKREGYYSRHIKLCRFLFYGGASFFNRNKTFYFY